MALALCVMAQAQQTRWEDRIQPGTAELIMFSFIVTAFCFPIIILFIIFYFRYKNRKARYQLMEKALSTGQPLPESLVEERKTKGAHTKGIKQTFTGIGLFVFLSMLTEVEIGSIGLLIMFMGIGQWIVDHKAEREEKEAKKKEQESQETPENQ